MQCCTGEASTRRLQPNCPLFQARERQEAALCWLKPKPPKEKKACVGRQRNSAEQAVFEFPSHRCSSIHTGCHRPPVSASRASALRVCVSLVCLLQQQVSRTSPSVKLRPCLLAAASHTFLHRHPPILAPVLLPFLATSSSSSSFSSFASPWSSQARPSPLSISTVPGRNPKLDSSYGLNPFVSSFTSTLASNE